MRYMLILPAIIVVVAMSIWPPSAGRAITPGVATYQYDNIGRVVQDSYPANSASYGYDFAGNRTASAVY